MLRACPLDSITGLCESCGQRDATIAWIGEGSSLDYVHGDFERWCELCVVTAQLDYAKAIVTKIPKLKAKLKELEGYE
jgi:hypothetical protein